MYRPEILNDWPITVSEDTFDGRGGFVRSVDALEEPTIDPDALTENYRIFKQNRRLFRDPKTGTWVSAYLLNPDAGQDELAAAVPTWLSSPGSHEPNQHFYSLLAAARPNVRHMIIDVPGLGRTSPLPAGERRYMGYSGRFNRAGEIMLRALGEDGYVPTEYLANSIGGRYVAGMAAAQEAPVKRMSLNDVPHASTSTHLNGYFRQEASLRSIGRESTTDPYVGVPEELEPFAADSLSFFGLIKQLGFRGISQKLAEGRAMGVRSSIDRPAVHPLQFDLQDVLDRHPGIQLTCVSPQESAVVEDPRDLHLILRGLRFNEQQRLSRLHIPGASHSYDDHHPSALVAAYLH